MIPSFPNFKKLELSDRDEVEVFTSQFPPYSDFNFTSLWVWDTLGQRTLSKLNGNLVVCFTDYENGSPMLSFLGINEPEKTARKLFQFTESIKIPPVLYFISEETANILKNSELHVEEDLNHCDYIFSTAHLSTFSGIKYKTKRHEVNKFLTLYPNVVFKTEKSISPTLRELIVNLSQKWFAKKGIDIGINNLGFESEKKALNRILHMENKNLLIFTCFLDDTLIGFEIDEIVSSQYAVAHFSKVDISYHGVGDFLNMKLSEYLKNEGIDFCNWEQDLGIGNLRKSKMSYGPVNFLKKYKISLLSKKIV